jgi:hypothetical protein
MKKIVFSLIITLGILTFKPSARAQDHSHFYVGAAGTNQNDKLIITNAPDFVTTTGYVKTLNYATTGQFAGYFEGNITFEAKAAFNAFGDSVTGSAALGSWIHAQITSVDGPADGAFSFWDAGATNPTVSVACGSTSTNTWYISNNNGVAGTDPFGHIHGRRFATSKPGIYVVSFKALDRSINGASGGPIHTDSDVMKVYFQAGFNLASVVRTGNVSTATFGAITNKTFYLEANSDLSNTNWTSINFVAGNDYFLSLNETNASSPRFYRMRITTP